MDIVKIQMNDNKLYKLKNIEKTFLVDSKLEIIQKLRFTENINKFQIWISTSKIIQKTIFEFATWKLIIPSLNTLNIQ